MRQTSNDLREAARLVSRACACRRLHAGVRGRARACAGGERTRRGTCVNRAVLTEARAILPALRLLWVPAAPWRARGYG